MRDKFITYKDIPSLAWRPIWSTSPLTDVLVSEEELKLLNQMKTNNSIIIFKIDKR